MTLYALLGKDCGDILTLDGRPIVHNNRQEIEWLLPETRVVPVTAGDLSRRSPLPPLQLRDHPDLGGLTWPLDPAQFQCGRGR